MVTSYHDVFLVRDKEPGKRGYRYDALYRHEIIATSTDPEYEACRALLARGKTGMARFWRPGKAQPDSSFDIERGSKWRASDGDRALRIGRYQEFPSDVVFGIKEAA